MHVRDSAFLFIVFTSYLSGIKLDAGWYSKESATKQISHITKWMQHERKKPDVCKAGNEALRTHICDLVSLLAKNVIDVENSSSDEDGSDQDN